MTLTSRRSWLTARPVVTLLVSMALAVPSAASARFEFHDLMPDFWAFWAEAAGRTPAEQSSLWERLYRSAHADVLNALPCRALKSPGGPVAHFASIPRLSPAMHRVADRVQETVPIAERRFARRFPDMRWHGAVYLLYTGGCFDGRPADIHGGSALMFGADVIAEVGETDLVPLVQHEMFHLYHAQFFAAADPAPLWTSLWQEGLAVYAAQSLNHRTANVNLLTPDALVAAVDARRGELASDFLRRFASSAAADNSLYFDGASVDARIPTRAGYRLGYLIARHLERSEGYGLSTMAHWSVAEAEPHVRAALIALSGRADGRTD